MRLQPAGTQARERTVSPAACSRFLIGVRPYQGRGVVRRSSQNSEVRRQKEGESAPKAFGVNSVRRQRSATASFLRSNYPVRAVGQKYLSHDRRTVGTQGVADALVEFVEGHAGVFLAGQQ